MSKRSPKLKVENLDRVPYNGIKGEIEPLDLLLFRGEDFVSKTIRFLEKAVLGNGSFSHVGIVVTRELMPWLKMLKPGEKYVWESTMSIPLGGMVEDVPDIESGKGKFGVQIRFLEDVIDSYTNDETGALVAWVPLKDNPWLHKSNHKDIKRKVKKLHKKVGCRTYELNFLELVASLFPPLRIFRKKTEWVEDIGFGILRSFDLVEGEGDSESGDAFYFCSELVAYIYQKLGIISESINPNEVVPMDFLGYDRDEMREIIEVDPIVLVPS